MVQCYRGQTGPAAYPLMEIILFKSFRKTNEAKKNKLHILLSSEWVGEVGVVKGGACWDAGEAMMTILMTDAFSVV